ncbi:hypothetical protein XA68_11307 [Ophiocordyceps unilateralis]|uniref:SAP domain-containing protein n=1 Tax=Ophiocordyceps unilateralis TaxID=268505 RepID=A0A2A9PGR1_OPHUN|nr:hypothetical protein XA68_11307 [Ophiocordyceps unilateralis]
MTDYASLKVPELKKLLADKKLPQTGNKADLISRLQENDEKDVTPGDTATPTAAQKPGKEEEDVAQPEKEVSKPKATEPQTAAAAANNEPQQDVQDKSDEQQQPEPASGETAPPKGDDKATKPVSEEAAPAFAMGLSTTAADAEAQKRVDRAKRFGIEEDDEYKKRADRAKRFGVDENIIASGLDSALPERAPKRGRGRDADDDTRRNGKRQQVDRRGDRRATRQTTTRQTRNNGAARKGGSVLDDPVRLCSPD